MCPDRQLLSVYLDRELPSPWKEKLETHLHGCPSCQARLERLQAVSMAVTAPFQREIGGEAIGRVWSKILENGAPRSSWHSRLDFWNRTITIPLPAAAAAAAAAIAVFIMAFAVIFGPARYQRQMETALTSITPDIQEIVPAADLEEVLQYLGNDHGSEIVIIQLPESRNFMSYGKPTIIKAADYSRDN